MVPFAPGNQSAEQNTTLNAFNLRGKKKTYPDNQLVEPIEYVCFWNV